MEQRFADLKPLAEPISTPPDPKGFVGVLLAAITALAWTIRELVRFWGGGHDRRSANHPEKSDDPLYQAMRADIDRLEGIVSKLGRDVAYIKGHLSRGRKTDQEGF